MTPQSPRSALTRHRECILVLLAASGPRGRVPGVTNLSPECEIEDVINQDVKQATVWVVEEQALKKKKVRKNVLSCKLFSFFLSSQIHHQMAHMSEFFRFLIDWCHQLFSYHNRRKQNKTLFSDALHFYQLGLKLLEMSKLESNMVLFSKHLLNDLCNFFPCQIKSNHPCLIKLWNDRSRQKKTLNVFFTTYNFD